MVKAILALLVRLLVSLVAAAGLVVLQAPLLQRLAAVRAVPARLRKSRGQRMLEEAAAAPQAAATSLPVALAAAAEVGLQRGRPQVARGQETLAEAVAAVARTSVVATAALEL